MTLTPEPSTAPLGAFLLRLSLGLMWLSHGLLLKLMTFGIAGLAAWLGSVGLPPALAWPLVIAETAGGLAILLGWHGRWASLALLPVLIGATAIHAGNGWVFSNANGGWEFPLFWAIVQGAIALLGSGAYALKPSASATVAA